MQSTTWKSPLLQDRLSTGRSFRNEARHRAAAVLQSEAARVDGKLCDDVAVLLAGNAVYIPSFLCDESDTRLYDRLKAELVAATGADMSSDGGRIEWSRHEKFENPTGISAAFNEVVDMLTEYFDLDAYATRLNYYRDGQQWKPQHHDSHAYGGNSAHANANASGGERLREDFTVGISLGAARSLVFVHEASGHSFDFPQRNGDCFAFTSDVNNMFTHGVPRVNTPIGDRFSIIVWGRRRTINARNGGEVASGADVRLKDGSEVQTVEDAIRAAHELVSRASPSTRPGSTNISSGGGTKENNDGSSVPAKKKKKNRLQ